MMPMTKIRQRNSRGQGSPRFPWPSLQETVVTAVDRLLGPVR
jgi:hypothetical protein